LYESVIENNDKYVDIEIMVHGWTNKTKLNKRTIGITFALWVTKCFRNHGQNGFSHELFIYDFLGFFCK
jgi:hypothetical protein